MIGQTLMLKQSIQQFVRIVKISHTRQFLGAYPKNCKIYLVRSLHQLLLSPGRDIEEHRYRHEPMEHFRTRLNIGPNKFHIILSQDRFYAMPERLHLGLPLFSIFSKIVK